MWQHAYQFYLVGNISPMIENGIVAKPTEQPINERMMETRGIQPHTVDVDALKYKNNPRTVIERLMIKADVISRGLRPALSTITRETEVWLKEKGNKEYFNTSC